MKKALMSEQKMQAPLQHTSAWFAQTWLSFAIALSATSIGIVYMPVDLWTKGYLGMGYLFTIGSTVSLSKTIRDQEESKRIINRVDEVKLERFLAEHDPFKNQ